jgi:UDP-N-acetylmuramyl pentapeptide phosphotransferase/UDP-N-acetylglucosamine-1-phosphate transferase
MTFLLLALFASLIVTLWVVHSAKTHAHLSNDHDLSGPQKFHAFPVPRIGGVGIVAGISAAAALLAWRHQGGAELALGLVACGLPAFVAGLTEDLTKSVSPRRRLVATAFSAALAAWFLGAVISRTDIPGIDWLVTHAWAAMALAVLVVAGVANAVNIVDGFNGLASMCGVMMLASIAYVAVQVGDPVIAALALAGVGAVLGFFVWNFPAGLIFLGDGGAYFLGFYIAELAILLVQRNPLVSPIFPLLLCVYPIFETLFSIYRKKFIRGMSPGVPDGVHFHMLVYKRLMRWAVGNRNAKELTRRNSMTSPYLWLLCMLAVAPAVLWWDDTAVLTAFIFLFAFTYVVLYWKIVRFKSPRWLVFRR